MYRFRSKSLIFGLIFVFFLLPCTLLQDTAAAFLLPARQGPAITLSEDEMNVSVDYATPVKQGAYTAVTLQVFDPEGKNVLEMPMERSPMNGRWQADYAVAELDSDMPGVYALCLTGTKNGKAEELSRGELVLQGAKARLYGTQPDKAAGTFELRLDELSSVCPVKGVYYTVESPDGTRRIYPASFEDPSCCRARVTLAKQNYSWGTYRITAEAQLANGLRAVAGEIRYDFEPENYVRILGGPDSARRQVIIYNPSASSLTLEVYSQEGITGEQKDDVMIYRPVKEGNTASAEVKVSCLKHTGKAYVDVKAGKKLLATAAFENTNETLTGTTGWRYETYNGEKYRFYFDENEKVTEPDAMPNLADLVELDKLKIVINRKACVVTVYAWDEAAGQYNTPIKAFTVSVGRDTRSQKGAGGLHEDTSYTPLGAFEISKKNGRDRYELKPMVEPDDSVVYARWATHIVGNVYFHSIAVGKRSHYALSPGTFNRLGRPASAGCIRMAVADAKWIYDHVSLGTAVIIEAGDPDYPGPLGKPETIKARGIRYDPTDPEIPDEEKEKDYKAGRITGYRRADGTLAGIGGRE